VCRIIGCHECTCYNCCVVQINSSITCGQWFSRSLGVTSYSSFIIEATFGSHSIIVNVIRFEIDSYKFIIGFLANILPKNPRMTSYHEYLVMVRLFFFWNICVACFFFKKLSFLFYYPPNPWSLVHYFFFPNLIFTTIINFLTSFTTIGVKNIMEFLTLLIPNLTYLTIIVIILATAYGKWSFLSLVTSSLFLFVFLHSSY